MTLEQRAAALAVQMLGRDDKGGCDAMLIYAAFRAVAAETIDRAARVIEQGQEAHSSNSERDDYYLGPRRHNNLAGLAYAKAIRALAIAPETAAALLDVDRELQLIAAQCGTPDAAKAEEE